MAYPNLPGLLLLSIATFFFNLAYNSFCSIYSHVLKTNGYSNLGFYILAVGYIVQSLSCLMVPSVDNLINNRRVLQISVIPTIFWMISLFLAAFLHKGQEYILIFSFLTAVFNGIGGSFMMVTQGKYLALCVKVKEERAGLYTSIYWAFSLGSQIFSYLMNAVILSFSSKVVLILVCIGVTIISLILFAFLPEPILPEDYIQEYEGFSNTFRSLFKMFKDTRIVKMYGLFINSAISSGIMCAILIPFFLDIVSDETESTQLRKAYMIMIVYGIGAMGGGWVIGFINDTWGGSKRVSFVSNILHLIVFGSIIICNIIHEYNTLCYIAGFLMGCQDSALMTQISIIISSEFSETAQPFAILYVMKYAFMSAVIYTGSLLTDQTRYTIYYSILGLFVVIFQTMFYFTFNFRITPPYWSYESTDDEKKRIKAK